AVAIECDDCHGTPYAPATLVTSGPTGGEDLTRGVTPFGTPWLAREGDVVVQRSRTDPARSRIVPQLSSIVAGRGGYAHRQPLESGPEQGTRAYAHIAPAGQGGGLECYACHSSFTPACTSCHVKQDVSVATREVWYGDDVV